MDPTNVNGATAFLAYTPLQTNGSIATAELERSGAFVRPAWQAFVALLIAAFLPVIQSAWAQTARPELIGFTSGDLELKGFIWKPSGDGPFPALLWNHGSGRSVGPLDTVAPYFVSKGYVFFVPHRRSHGHSPRDSFVDSLYDQGARRVVALHEVHLEDQLAAIHYLKGLPYVDTGKIAVAGCSYGGIQTILAVEANTEKKLGLRAAIDFAGGAITWRRSFDLRERMLRAVKKATIPILLIQAENDYDLGPSRALAKEFERSGKPHSLLIYPPFGVTVQEGHSFCVRGTEIWGSDVLKFIETHLK
jgi:carboxymethylenebutenolidase